MAFAYLTILRPLNSLMSVLSVYIASVIAGLGFYPGTPVLYALVSVFLISAGGMVINDYFDVEIDRVNKPSRPIPSGKISKTTALGYSYVLFGAGVYLSYLINAFAFSVAVLASALLILYAWKLKRVTMLGHLVISALVALTFIYGGLVNMNFIPALPLALLAFLSNTGREIYKSIEDVMGDKQAGVQSVAIKYGVTRAKAVASIFLLFAIILSFVPFFLGIFGEVYLFFVAIADILFLAAVVGPARLSSKMCKIAMLVALIAFLAGSTAA